MEPDRIIVVGASAGGVEATMALVRELPPDFPAALFITIHFPPDVESYLPTILSRVTKLAVVPAANGAPIAAGTVYVARPGQHLLLRRGLIRLSRGPTENGNRPAIDPMFRSAALAYGARVIGVVLTGNLDDGTSGLLTIKRRGGIAVVQDPADAMFPPMPTSAIRHVMVDHVAPLAAIPELLRALVAEPAPERMGGEVMDDARQENEFSSFDLEAMDETAAHPGTPSAFGCPDCGGVLWEIRDGDLVRYRCRVGHGWTSDALASEQQVTLEDALWTALRALEESAQLNEQLAQRLGQRGAERLRDRFASRSANLRDQAALIRQILVDSAKPDEG
ncbi:MAG TPA: chemotaxis protein CheB [Gemmatimonadaceae bacterium]|nr:chemotaxis protein CheB [Gemmatimonadaceae bacterium]